MRFTWYGHACFLVEGLKDDGGPVRILTDPYKSPDCGGYGPVDEAADIVTLSHLNPVYHSDLSTIQGDYGARARARRSIYDYLKAFALKAGRRRGF